MLQNVKPIPWYRLSHHWQATPEQIRTGLSQLTGPWQMLLLGDGAVTRHLQLLTGAEVTVDVVAMEATTEDDQAPPEVSAVPGPRLRRQVWLMAGGERLAYAVSWWGIQSVDRYLEDRSLPIWKSLAVKRTEHFRDIRGLVCGEEPALTHAFGVPGQLWGRYYLLWSQGQPLTLIYEVFSPRLNHYLGEPAKMG
ncbi:chorismate lyase [Candidatus Cyanaurora vandensis]|uniref:chorismate lyase n=1 Tax=Candidatus Cyanaurora vandensis TaxID=2714958 RepID=UPI00257C72F9|nr:chorismate lyase [Candidatus Cyanaurora vandensis]